MDTNDIPKTYDFRDTEERIYQNWEENKYFKPANDPNQPGHDPAIKPFVISIPPPNVTGELHLGHVMFVAMEDLMIRYHRMKGVPTLWVPGSDHAGIATQLQVEKSLAKENLTRDEIGRERFLELSWAWKEKYGGIITQQIRRLGASCDWDRERFTLDAGLSRAVREAFVRLYEKGLIYRGPRIINWSPGLKTAVSDLEVEYSMEPGKLYYFKYQLAGSADEHIPVATTRPETILGDTALAIHPQDPRYQKYIGRNVVVPILKREIPVIVDEYVDLEFGTGALKVTPGHDPNDYAIAQRHGLPVISILDEAARVTKEGGPYAGQDRFEARKNLWDDMRAANLVIKEEPYMLNIPRSQRGGEIIEPMVSTQWFVKTKPLAEAALDAVRSGQIRIVPERFTKVYYNWLENIEDWCISRQLWWGHRIPVWYCQECNKMTVTRQDPTNCVYCSSENINQDPDVLDTWFSSALWPFSTLGWPDETPDYCYFYPTTIMETGYDILFFWVARMIMTGLEFTGKPPFQTVYLHGLIRDERGKKMSKSYENAIDPLVVMDDLGTDALRFTLLVGSTPGNDVNVSVKKVEANRNFANKVWNVSRFVITSIQHLAEVKGQPPDTEFIKDQLDKKTDWTDADAWIIARTRTLVRDIERLFQNHQYGEAGRQIYDFIWSEFADWYVEIAKQQVSEGGQRAYQTAQILVDVLDIGLRFLHPYTPFITEELWGFLKQACLELDPPLIPTHLSRAAKTEDQVWEDALVVACWPEPTDQEDWEDQAVTHFSLIINTVRAIRNTRAEKNIQPSKRIPAIIVAGEHAEMFRRQSAAIASLARLDTKHLSITETLPSKPKGYIPLVVGSIEVYLSLEDTISIGEERTRLDKELAEASVQIQRLTNLLNSPFAEKAPPPVVQKEGEKLDRFKEAAKKLKNQIESLEGKSRSE
ncbi:MAG: valine--tRNA ligase [Anaerolineales bacterium]|nr:valine--tRNA ligase [Anaerolineales bacterium]